MGWCCRSPTSPPKTMATMRLGTSKEQSVTCWCEAGNEAMTLLNHPFWFPFRGPLGSVPHSLPSTSQIQIPPATASPHPKHNGAGTQLLRPQSFRFGDETRSPEEVLYWRFLYFRFRDYINSPRLMTKPEEIGLGSLGFLWLSFTGHSS